MDISGTRTSLGDICMFRAGTAFPKRFQGEMHGEIPFIKVSDLKHRANSLYIRHSANWVDMVTVEHLKASLLYPGTIVFAKIGEGLKAERFRLVARPTCIDNNLMGAIPQGVDAHFLYYLMVHTGVAHLVEGSALPYLRQSDLERIPVCVPSNDEQRRIAGVLGVLDDKIESNCAQQRIGEQLLRAVIEGILGQFSEADFISFDAYCTQSKESVRPENIGNGDKYIALEHMPRGSIFLNSWETAKLAGIASNKTRFRHGDLLFGKLRPYFKKVGVAPVSGVCSTDILVIRPRLPEFLPFIAVIASSDALIDSISASATGTRMPRASWKEIATWPVPQIPDETLTVLLHPANQLMAFLETLSLQNLKLAQLRDALLPELMSGRMRVDEAGCLVSEALDKEVADV